MEKVTEPERVFEKAGPCLYRYTATGTYYALVKVKGRQVHRSLETDDRALAKRRLTDRQRDLLRVDVAAGRRFLATLCGRFQATVANPSARTRDKRRRSPHASKASLPSALRLFFGHEQFSS